MQLRYEADLRLRRSHALNKGLKSFIVYSIPVLNVLRVSQVKCGERGVLVHKSEKLLLESPSINIVVSEFDAHNSFVLPQTSYQVVKTQTQIVHA